MGLTEGLVVVLIVVAIVAGGVLIYALVEAIRTFRSVRALSDDLLRTLPPLVEKTDVAVEAFSAELLRIDTIVTGLEGAIERVSHTAEVVQEAVHTPAAVVNAAGERIREAWSRAKRSRG